VREVVQVDLDPTAVIRPDALLIAHGKPAASSFGLRPGNGEQIPPDNPPETLSEKRGIAKGEDSFDLDKEGGWVYKFPFEIDGRPM
jgi:hypothetical protein